MLIKATQLCRCGHKAAAHTKDVFIRSVDDNDSSTLEMVQKKRSTFHVCAVNCTKFELNNLDLVEYLAEQRGLV